MPNPGPLAAALVAAAALTTAAASQGVESTATAPFVNFESSGIRPLHLLPGGTRLVALNTPDHRIEVYAAQDGVLEHVGGVFTGLEPVAVTHAPDDSSTLFVSNHLSDTVSVVDLERFAVVATIHVGDEPRDLAFAAGKLFVATSRSGEPSMVPGPPVDNALVVVDAAPPYAIVDRIELAGHMPRAVECVGERVAVAVQNSGNETTILSLPDMDALGLGPLDLIGSDDPFDVNPVLLSPGFTTGGFNNNIFGVNGWVVPDTSRIVRDDEFPGHTPDLADDDVFFVDALSLDVVDTTKGVGTTLFDIVRNPATGGLWVTNTDADNRTRFEPRVKGATVSNRVTTVSPGGDATGTIDLAPPLTSTEHAQPAAVAFYAGPDRGPLAYVGALGTGTVVVLDAVSGTLVAELDVGLLPTGLAVDDARGILYVFSRIDDTIRAYDVLDGHAPIGRPTPLPYDPEPALVDVGREHLYSAREDGHGNGNTSCATCHVSGHVDQLAWDLGDPEGGIGYFAPEIMTGTASFGGQKVAQKKTNMIHPMKGPMTTQSLRGLGVDGAAPFHWRGDRPFFQHFQGAFVGLLGGSGVTDAQMQEFTAFVESIAHPPNPLQPKDRDYVGGAQAGVETYGLEPGVPGSVYNPLLPGATCNSCHSADFAGGTDFDGSQPTVNFDAEPQLFNAAQLRGVYEKEYRHLTGFGTLHDGSLDGTLDFLTNPLIGGDPFPLLSTAERVELEQLVLQWDSGLAPAVGMQATSSTVAPADLASFLAFAEGQAQIGHVDLVGRITPTVGAPTTTGLHFSPDDATAGWSYLTDVGRRASGADLLAAIGAGTFDATFTLVPPGSGARLGVDRDEDGLLDGVERALGTSPTDPDTDDDGFADGHEVAHGGAPRVPDATLPGDTAPPGVTTLEARGVAATAATLHVVLDEAATLAVALGSAPGLGDLGTLAVPVLRRRHDVVLTGLPADTTVHVDVTAADGNGAASTTSTTFLTAPPEYHVGALELLSDVDGVTGETTVTARARIVDSSGAPVPDMSLRGIWAGEIGAADFFPIEVSDTDGWATFTLGPYAPPPGAEVSFGPAYVGTNNTAGPGFIGFGGQRPDFFYTQIRNAANSATITLP